MVRRSAVAVLRAFGAAATTVDIVGRSNRHVVLVPATVTTRSWGVEPGEIVAEQLAVTGRLEAVDLKTRRFRIRDDVGNRIDLPRVDDADSASKLVGTRVTAVGVGVTNGRGRLLSVNDAEVAAAPTPDRLRPGARADLALVFGSVGPDLDGGIDLSDADFDDFLALVRR